MYQISDICYGADNVTRNVCVLADGAAGRLWCAAVEMGGIGAAVRLLRAMDSSAFDTEVAAARRQADNLARAARKDGKVLRANPYFVRGRRARERAGLYASWTAEQRQADRAARLQESGPFDRGAELRGDDDDVYDD